MTALGVGGFCSSLIRSMREIALAVTRFAGLCLAAAVLAAAATAASAAAPAIRTSDYNKVPACVTPSRLMHFLRERNPALEPRYDEIARWYKRHGDSWRVRWDYAFFQMIVETNYLKFQTGSGRSGDVKPQQNNFAGIGTTGGGVPGDGYPDVSTGVLAQIQHLVAYSGERMDQPVAPRTQKAQDDIIAVSARLKRTVTFGDLSGRWAVDRRYWRTIEAVAERFREIHCNNSPVPDELPPKLVKPPQMVSLRQRTAMVADAAPPVVAAAMVLPAVRPAIPPPVARPTACKVQTASFVGQTGARKTLLIRSEAGGELHITALQVLGGFERSMADSYIKSRAPGGSIVGEFDSHESALGRANEMCANG